MLIVLKLIQKKLNSKSNIKSLLCENEQMKHLLKFHPRLADLALSETFGSLVKICLRIFFYLNI